MPDLTTPSRLRTKSENTDSTGKTDKLDTSSRPSRSTGNNRRRGKDAAEVGKFRPKPDWSDWPPLADFVVVSRLARSQLNRC